MKMCTRCVLPETYPGITFHRDGICNYCIKYETEEKTGSGKHFSCEEELIASLRKYKNIHPKYDVLVPVSGGIDSCYALIKIVETFKLRPLVFHNDHGFDNETATDNVKRLCKKLDVDLIIWQYESGFMKKLFKYFNEADVYGLSTCHVCGNMLYFNAIELADHFGIKLVINGYSKGQAAFIRETEKARELLAQIIEIVSGDKEFLETLTAKYKMLKKQKKFLSKKDIEDQVDPRKILVVPFYIFRFYKTHKEKLQEECQRRFDWQPIENSYPSRTTNCEMIWLNTYVDFKKSKFSLYQDEYATMIRAGDFSRDQALKDLEFNPPDGLIERLAKEIDLDLTKIKEAAPQQEEIAEFITAQSILSAAREGDFKL
jgi:tRNA(Ile)-lysidine synthase TilS/MesJ